MCEDNCVAGILISLYKTLRSTAMYTNPVGACGSVVCGVAVLPNTGGNELLIAASVVSIVLGLAIVVTTAVRQAAKKKAVKA